MFFISLTIITLSVCCLIIIKKTGFYKSLALTWNADLHHTKHVLYTNQTWHLQVYDPFLLEGHYLVLVTGNPVFLQSKKVRDKGEDNSLSELTWVLALL